MKILKDTYAVFWTRKGWKQAFHADICAATPNEAYSQFAGMFPSDIVRSIRDKSGKFCKFK